MRMGVGGGGGGWQGVRIPCQIYEKAMSQALAFCQKRNDMSSITFKNIHVAKAPFHLSKFKSTVASALNPKVAC